jgi:hypothetical protein
MAGSWDFSFKAAAASAAWCLGLSLLREECPFVNGGALSENFISPSIDTRRFSKTDIDMKLGRPVAAEALPESKGG